MMTLMDITLEEFHIMLSVLSATCEGNTSGTGMYGGYSREKRQEIASNILSKMRDDIEVSVKVKSRKMSFDSGNKD